jgi:hypothetical protein
MALAVVAVAAVSPSALFLLLVFVVSVLLTVTEGNSHLIVQGKDDWIVRDDSSSGPVSVRPVRITLLGHKISVPNEMKGGQ